MEEKIFLDMGEARLANGHDLIVAEGIGSCVVVILMDPEEKISGAAHIVLPAGGEEKQPKRADTLLNELLGELTSEGAEREDLTAKIFGGAEIFGFSGDIGEKNIESVKQILDDKDIEIAVEDTGGEKGRNIEYEPATGKAEVCDSQDNCKYY